MIASLNRKRLKTPNDGSKPEFHLKWIRELVTGNAAGSADVENRDWPHISSSHAEFRGSIALEATSEHTRLYVRVDLFQRSIRNRAPTGRNSSVQAIMANIGTKEKKFGSSVERAGQLACRFKDVALRSSHECLRHIIRGGAPTWDRSSRRILPADIPPESPPLAAMPRLPPW